MKESPMRSRDKALQSLYEMEINIDKHLIKTLKSREDIGRFCQDLIIGVIDNIKELDIDDVIAHLLVAEGFDTVEDIAEAAIEELSELQGFDQDISEELKNRALTYVENERMRISETIAKLKIEEDLISFSGLNTSQIIKLAENGVKTKEGLADLDSAELVEILSELGLDSEEEAGKIIMLARAHWFEDEEVESDTEKETEKEV